MATPLAVDLYSRTMVELFDEKSIISVPSVFQSMFGKPENGSRTVYSPDANNIEIDIIRANERLAALIQRGTESRNLDLKNTKAEKFTNQTRQFPLGEEQGNITASQLVNRVAGERPYEQRSRLDRNRYFALEHHQEHVRRFARLFEYLAAQSVITGKMPAILGTTNNDLIYDFRRSSSNFITVSPLWSATTPTMLANLDAACDQARTQGHVTCDYVLMGGDASSWFFQDTNVKAMADIKGFNLVTVGPNMPVPSKLQFLVDGGAIARGMVTTPKGYNLWLFTYVDSYTASGGTATAYVTAGKVVVGYSGARCDRYFGPADTLPITPTEQAWYMERFGFNMGLEPMPPNIKNQGAVINPAMFYFDAYQSSDRKKVTIRTQTAPIFATTQTDAFVVLTVL